MSNPISRFPKQQITQILNKARVIEKVQEKPKYIKSSIPDCEFTDNIVELKDLKITDSGLYNISLQLCIQCKDVEMCNSIQFGLCKKDYSNNGDCLKSVIVNTEYNTGNLYIDNLVSNVELQEQEEYIIWCAIVSPDNSKFCVNGTYCNLSLVRI